MMSIIGWLLVIYICAGIVWTLIHYAILSYNDEFDSYMSEAYDVLCMSSGMKINERTAYLFITVGFILSWLIITIGIFDRRDGA